jgi:hypothetical protein
MSWKNTIKKYDDTIDYSEQLDLNRKKMSLLQDFYSELESRLEEMSELKGTKFHTSREIIMERIEHLMANLDREIGYTII